CGSAGVARRVAPAPTIAQRAPRRTVTGLQTGLMHAQGASLTDAARSAIAVFVTGRALGSMAPPATAPRCSDAGTPLVARASDPSWNGWGAGPTNNRYQPAGSAGLTAVQIPSLQVKWAFGFAGDLMAAAQPAVVGGRVFIGSTSG